MSRKDSLQNDLKAALLSGDRFAGEVLRGLKAAILNEEVAKQKRDTGLDDAEIEQVIAREVKKRRESIAMYEQNGRSDLAETEQRELAVLEKYLPEQLSDDDIRQLVRAEISAHEAVDRKAMGKIIGAVKSKTGTAADGQVIARIVKEEIEAS